MRNIPSSIQDKINKQNQTIYENANPKMNVAIARAKTTVMDSTYWTVETIREKAGLGDVSLAPRRFKTRGTPNRIYEIHVDNGIVKTSIREYPDKLKDGWQDQFTLGAGSNVAIAFNGHWERYRKLWRLVTDEKPHILWVDGDGKLQTQLWDDATSKQELATNVKYVRALRGWKNATFKYLDQGIVAAYIKTDGTVWYRNYANQTNGTTVWEYEKQLLEFTGTAVSLNLFITNDYRIGFIIEDNLGRIFWYITERNWAGMASPSEFISTGINDIEFDVYDIQYLENKFQENINVGISDVWFNAATPIYPEPIFAENISETQIILKFNHIIDYDLTDIVAAFKIRDSQSTYFVVNTTEAGVDNSEIVFNMDNFLNASGNMFIEYDRTKIELDCLNEDSRFIIESFSYEFTPDLAPPEYNDNENLTVGISNIIFSIKTLDDLNKGYDPENIAVSINDICFIITKVNNDPL